MGLNVVIHYITMMNMIKKEKKLIKAKIANKYSVFITSTEIPSCTLCLAKLDNFQERFL